MYSQLKCPNCGGTIAVDVNNEVITCDTCGKAYKNPYYQPIVEIEEVPVGEPVQDPQQEPQQPVQEPISQEPQQEPASQPQYTAEIENEPQEEQAVTQEAETCECHACQDEPIAQPKEGKKCAKPHAKPSKKHVISLVKTSIVLLLAILMFAFSFCPITGERHYSNMEGASGTDYIAYMFYTARHWDEEEAKDAKKIEKLEEKAEKLEEEEENVDESITYAPSGKVYFSSSYVKYYKKYQKLSAEYNLSIDGNVTKVEIAQIAFIGTISLLHVLFSGGMMILSAIALVISILNLIKNEDKKFFFEKYYYLLPLGLFLSLGVIFGVYMYVGEMLWAYSMVSGAFIARLFFECVSFALVLADKAVDIVKNKVKVRDWAFKALAIVLAIVAVGCCFAPAFYTKSVEDMDELGEIVTRKKFSTYILGTGAIIEEEYEEKYSDYEHEDWLDYIVEEVEDENFTSALEYMMREKQGASAGSLSTGYFFTMLAILALGGLVCAQLFTEEKAGLARKVLAGIAVACLLAAFICAIVLVATFNAYVGECEELLDEVLDYKAMLDGGVVCAFLFGAIALLAEILPEKLLPKKEEEKEEQTPQEDNVFVIE